IGQLSAGPATSPSPCTACPSPVEKSPPSTAIGRNSTVPSVSSRAIQIAAASRGGKGRLNTRLIEGHTHYSHERSQLQPLTRTVDANCPFQIEFPKRGMIAARHGEDGGRPSRPRPQPQMRIELRGSARPGRPAPPARTDTVDTDF